MPRKIASSRFGLLQRRRIVWPALGLFVAVFGVLASQYVLNSRAATACTTSEKLVPSCGALWGFYTSGNGDVRPTEKVVGRTFDVVHAYHDFSNLGANGVFPTTLENTYMAGDRTMLYAWETRVYGTSRDPKMPAPGGANNTYTYRQITSGSLDGYIDAVAARIKGVGKPVFMNFNHEADDAKGLGSGSNVYRQAAGSPAEFAAAWRYLADRFRAQGATNAVWVWVVAGFQSDATIYHQLYPGDAYVDWVAYDPYNFYTCNGRTTWKDVSATFGPFYDRLDQNLLGSVAAAKPRMLAEYGTHEDPNNASRAGDWYRSIPGLLKTKYPRIKALVHYNSTGICPTHVTSPPAQAATEDGFSAASNDDYLLQIGAPVVPVATVTPRPSSTPLPTVVPQTGARDTQAPSMPTGLGAAATPAGKVVLSWAASADNIGVDHYRITRDGGYNIGVTSATQWSDITVSGIGYHTYVVYAVDKAGNESVGSAKAVVLIPAPRSPGLLGSYFPAANFGGSPVRRTDPTVNFDWAYGSPAPGLPGNNFSVRWTGKITIPTSQIYTFMTTNDDGMRLYIGDVLMVNSWKDQSAATHSGRIALTGGQTYDIRVEYYEHTGKAVAKLQWSAPSFGTQIIPSSVLSH